jgi:hypothetical protein
MTIGSHPTFSSKEVPPFGKSAGIDDNTFRQLIYMPNHYLWSIQYIEIRHLEKIDMEMLLGADEDRSNTTTTIHQLLIEEDDMEGETIFQ